MKKNYDTSTIRKNPYTKLLKTQLTINISNEVLEYFKEMSERTLVPYQTLINFCLLDCVKKKKTIELSWEEQK